MTEVPVRRRPATAPLDAVVASAPHAPPHEQPRQAAVGARTHADGAAAVPDFEQVYTTHFHDVCRWARAFGGLEADLDDLAQEVFLVVRRKLRQYRGPSMAAWLYGITRKTVSDYRRRAWMRRLLSGTTRSMELTPALEAPQDADVSERSDARRILSQVLGRMSARRRSAFVLFEIEGYSGKEIAELEQIPLATVHTRLHHARKDFLRLVAEITGEPPEEPAP